MVYLFNNNLALLDLCKDSNNKRPERCIKIDDQVNHVKFVKTLNSDTISFKSLTNPTQKEKQEALEIDKLVKKHLLNPIKEKIKDVSAFVRLSAFEAVKILDPLKYVEKEQQMLKKAQDLTMEKIKKFNDGKDISSFIKELKNEGFKFCFADDLLPEDLWVDEEFLNSWKMDEYDIEEQIDDPKPLKVKDVLKKKGSAEIHYERKDCKALFIFNEKPPKPEVFWHEYFHYCQNMAGLMNYKGNKNENTGSRFAKRELETYEFIIGLRKLFNTKANDLKLDIAIWNSYKDLYHFEKEPQDKKSSRVKQLIERSFELGSTDGISDFNSISCNNVEEEVIISRERQLFKEIISRSGINPENVE
ncbi:MAG: hypothetical protein AB1782_08680 [Cyanobacteriota bacterium]